MLQEDRNIYEHGKVKKKQETIPAPRLSNAPDPLYDLRYKYKAESK